MEKNQLVKIHDYLSSNLLEDNIDPFYNQASLNLLDMIFEYLETKEGIVLTNENSVSILDKFYKENVRTNKNTNKVYELISLTSTSGSSSALSLLSETTLGNTFSYVETLIIATLTRQRELENARKIMKNTVFADIKGLTLEELNYLNALLRSEIEKNQNIIKKRPELKSFVSNDNLLNETIIRKIDLSINQKINENDKLTKND